MILYFRIPNPAAGDPYSRITPIDESEFRSAAGDRSPDQVVDLAALQQSEPDAIARRALAMETRRLPAGAVVVWRLRKETGLAEGWQVAPLTDLQVS
jgi:hypothetical protein